MNTRPINVIIIAEALPAHLDDVHAIMAEVANLSRMEEGCLRYDVYSDSEHPTRMNTIELWQDQASLDRHLASPHVRRGVMQLIGKMAGLPQLRILRPAVEELN